MEDIPEKPNRGEQKLIYGGNYWSPGKTLCWHLDFFLDLRRQERDGYLEGFAGREGLSERDLEDTRKRAEELFDSSLNLMEPEAKNFLDHIQDMGGLPTLEELESPGLCPKGAKACVFAVFLNAQIEGAVYDMAKTSADRNDDLHAMVARGVPSRYAIQFLHRVARCFLFGFDVECAVMCRVVLDWEFKAKVSNDDCVEVCGTRSPMGQEAFDLNERIAVAFRKGLISEGCRELAHDVRKSGNEAAHGTLRPDASRVAELIQHTIAVIEELHRDD